MPSNPILGTVLTANGDGSATFSSSSAVINLTGDASGTTAAVVNNQATGGVAGVYTITNPIGLSTGTISTIGLLRSPNNQTIIGARNALNTADIKVLGVDGSNNIFLGGTNDGYVALNASTGNLVKAQINSVDSVTISNNTISLAQPGTAYTISQATQTSDVATNDVTFISQAPFASASTNVKGGNIVLKVSPVVSGTTNNYVVVNTNNSNTGISLGSLPTSLSSYAIWLGVAPGTNNAALLHTAGITEVNGQAANLRFAIANSPQANLIAGNWTFFNSNTSITCGGTNCIGLGNATTNPTSNPTGGLIFYGDVNNSAFKARTVNGAITTLAARGSGGPINSQLQILDGYWGTVESVSNGVAETIGSYVTDSNSGGSMSITLISRATTTAGGVTAQDTVSTQYFLVYKNTAGTVALSTAGLTVVGALQTTNVSLTSVLTTSISGATITFLVTNTNLVTVDSELYLTVVKN